MKAKIVAIGNEVVSGRIIDINSAFLSAELVKLGVEPVAHVACRDEIGEISKILKENDQAQDLIFVTGGLGPTDDDLTRKAFSEAFSLELIKDDNSERDIVKFFKARGRKPGAMNLTQAMIPLGSKAIANRWGTAPGFSLERNGRIYYVLPGVPLEMKNMFLEYIARDIAKRFPDLPGKKFVTLKMFGIPESMLNEKINEIPKPVGVTLGFYPRMPEVHLVVNYSEKAGVLAGPGAGSIKRYIAEIKDVFDEYIFCEGDEKIEEKLIGALVENKLTLSVAESCTGGILAGMLVNVPGSSRCFERGVVTYSNESKLGLLAVSKKTLKKFGAVSAECAKEMADGVRRLAETDIGISTTGIAGPGGGTKDKPVGTTYIAISTRRFTNVEHFVFQRDRNMNRLLAVYEVMTRLSKLVLGRKIRK